MHGLDKVAHVSRVPGSASVRGIGLPAFKPEFPAVDSYAGLSRPWPRIRRLGTGLSSATDGGGRRRLASTSVTNLCFSGLAVSSAKWGVHIMHINFVLTYFAYFLHILAYICN